MNVRQGLRTAMLVGLGGIMGGTLVVAWGARRESGAALAREAERPRGELQQAQTSAIRGWEKGKGWGWIWGKDDEVGRLNALSN